jgi:hypothetical protein
VALIDARPRAKNFRREQRRVIRLNTLDDIVPRMKKPDGVDPPGVIDVQLNTSTPRSKLKVR